MASRPAPKPRMSDAERRAARGHTREDLVTRTKGHIGELIQKTVVRPTLVGQERTKRRFLDFFQILSESDPSVLEGLGCRDVVDVLKPGAYMLPTYIMLGFIDYLVEVSQGMLEEQITVSTLVNTIGLFLGMYNRATNLVIPSATTRDLFAYARGRCAIQYGLATRRREKGVADQVDIKLLQMQLWSDQDPIPSTRMRRQLSTFIELASASASRPGNIVESSCYSKSNESLLYDCLTFYIIPGGAGANDSDDVSSTDEECLERFNKEDWDFFRRREPQLVVKVRYDLLKGRRKQDGEFAEFVFPCEPLSNIGSCFVTNLLFFAFEDKAFSTIKNLDDLETLMRHATAPLRLAFDSAVLSTPILRSYSPHPVMRTSKSSSWTVSPQRAMTYGCLYTQLVKLGLRAGFQKRLKPYDLRRMGANKIDRSGLASSEQRRQIMGHDSLSRMFARYQDSLVHLDLPSIVRDREQSLDAVQTVGRLSLGADARAPIALSPEGLKKVWAIPEVKQSLARQDEAKAKCILLHGFSLKNSRDTEEGRNYRKAYYASRTVIRRHSAFLFETERQEWFQSQDRRLLEQVKATRSQPTSAATSDEMLVVDGVIILPDEDQEEDLENLDIRERYKSLGHIDINNLNNDQFTDIVESGAVEHLVKSLAEPSFLPFEPFVPATPTLQVRRLEVDYDPDIHYPPNLNKRLFGGFPDDGTLTARFKAWNELYRLPQFKVIPKTIHESGFYRNEGPTSDMHCRREECRRDLTKLTASQKAIHVHQCESKTRQAQADSELQEIYPFPIMCGWGTTCNTVFSDDYGECCTHMYSHIEYHFRRRTRDTSSFIKCGFEACQEMISHDSVKIHLLQDHNIMLSPVGFLRFCFFCHTWFTDEDDWDRHIHGHFRAWFEPFALPLHEAPITETFIGYHAIVSTGVILKPGFCPFCVWNAFGELSKIDERMHQYRNNQEISAHIIKIHHDRLLFEVKSNPLHCPCRTCAAGEFNLIELYNHLILAHLIPMAGIRHKKKSTNEFPTLETLDDLAIQWIQPKRKTRNAGIQSPPISVQSSPSAQPKPAKKAKAVITSTSSSRLEENNK